MKYLQAYFSDVGTKRAINEDSLALLKAETHFGDVLLAVLCDGMGGHSAGELASKYCVERFAQWFKTDFPRLLYEGFDEETLKAVWTQLVRDINYKLAAYGEENAAELGSTMTAFLFFQDRYYIAHVGDSRGYEIADQTRQLTSDQSFIASEVQRGALTAEAAQKDRRRNYLLECLGITYHVNMFFASGTVQEDATYLLCTDGFWHCLMDGELQRYLSSKAVKNNQTMRMHLNFLVEQVKLRGEKDNISAIAVIPTTRNEV